MASVEDSWSTTKSWGGCGTRDSWRRRRAPSRQRSCGEGHGGRRRSHACRRSRPEPPLPLLLPPRTAIAVTIVTDALPSSCRHHHRSDCTRRRRCSTWNRRRPLPRLLHAMPPCGLMTPPDRSACAPAAPWPRADRALTRPRSPAFLTNILPPYAIPAQSRSHRRSAWIVVGRFPARAAPSSSPNTASQGRKEDRGEDAVLPIAKAGFSLPSPRCRLPPPEMEALLRWAAELGVCDSPLGPSASSCLGRSLVIADFPDAGGRGLAAARDLRCGELVLRVPRSALFTSDRVMADDPQVATCVASHLPHLSSVQTLIICLLTEVGRGRSSNWYLYLSQLPTYYTILATFNDFETEALQVDDAIWVAQKALRGIRSDWEEATPLMKRLGLKPKLLMFKSWLWAFATVSSRTLHIAWDGAGCLCPIGDLFNYAAPDDDNSLADEDTYDMMHQKTNKMLDKITFDHSYERLTDGGYEDVNGYCLYARKSYRKGEQVLLAYGMYTNLELLEHYGFLLGVMCFEDFTLSELHELGRTGVDSDYFSCAGLLVEE
ncbi:hypothetical protein GUJ93_ZPchr0013g35847 [Zizania palustris]|uniref:SET domain-containing protein n=1 Tax=Zizania palustris TaxID=103762 RepID=A0A8J6C1Q1_ZIZPA|nr:hypothetical protein GUJ93_ZPchr0013g35847 [Zizania palustris]